MFSKWFRHRASRHEGNVLHDDETLTIRHIPGTGQRVIVAFTGIGHEMGKIQRDEFVSSSVDGGRSHAIFVTDRRRSWFSGYGVPERIEEILGRFFGQAGTTDIHMLGNSMGGFGALLFCERLGASSAVAFVPQFTMKQTIINETRWSKYRSNMIEARLEALDRHLTGACRTHAFFGSQDHADAPHVEALRETGHVKVHLVPEAGHDVAAVLKERGVLADTIQAAFATPGKACRPFGAVPARACNE